MSTPKLVYGFLVSSFILANGSFAAGLKNDKLCKKFDSKANLMAIAVQSQTKDLFTICELGDEELWSTWILIKSHTRSPDKITATYIVPAYVELFVVANSIDSGFPAFLDDDESHADLRLLMNKCEDEDPALEDLLRKYCNEGADLSKQVILSISDDNFSVTYMDAERQSLVAEGKTADNSNPS